MRVMARRSKSDESDNWPSAEPEVSFCQLCQREGVEITEHHLIPRSQAKRRGIKPDQLPVVHLCAPCHKFLHLKFTNSELARQYNDIEVLRQHEEVKSFVAWISKQPASKITRVR